MKKNEIKKTIEQVVRVEYIAEDGHVFYGADGEEECRKYEESALFAVRNKLKKLNNSKTSIYDLNNDGSEECELEIFDVQTPEDLENLRRYLYLKLSKNGASENIIEDVFSSECRKQYIFDNVTFGHAVMVFWSYDGDWAWTYGNGSIEDYCKWIKSNYDKIITPEEPETNS